jgi:hypothetical protein
VALADGSKRSFFKTTYSFVSVGAVSLMIAAAPAMGAGVNGSTGV